MSDLVERVVNAMTAAMDGDDCTGHGMARAAIREVAVWLEDQDVPLSTDPLQIAINRLLKQLEETK